MSGRYNVRSGIFILPATMKKPQELAAMIFKEIGYKDNQFDVSRMPNDTYPEINWNLTTADSALDDLCKQLNCHVTLSHEDVPVIYPEGFGKDLPAVPSSQQSATFDIGLVPGRVMVASAPVMFQLDFPIFPVGLDLDNQVKPIDDLSYTPISGWKSCDSFANVTVKGKQYRQDTYKEYFTAKKLAEQCIYKWWQIKVPEELNGKMPYFNLPIVSPAQFFPLLDSQIETFALSADEVVKKDDNLFDKTMYNRLEPMIFGRFDADNGYRTNNDPYDQLNKSRQSIQHIGFAVWDRGLRIDNDRMVIITDERIRQTYGGLAGPDVLYLRVACNFHSHNTRAPFRLEIHKEMKDAPDQKSKSVVVRDDVVPEVIFKWTNERTASPDSDRQSLKTIQSRDNIAEVKEKLQYYLGFELLKHQPKIPSSITTPVLFPFSPDGQIAQVNFRIEGNGFIGTGIFRQREDVTNLVTYDERRRELQRMNTMEQLARQYRKNGVNQK